MKGKYSLKQQIYPLIQANLTMQPVSLFYMYRLPVYYIYSNQMIQNITLANICKTPSY